MSDLWNDGYPIHFSRAEIQKAGPLEHGLSLMATATSHWNAETRKKAAKRGIALKDGSYPIADVADLKKAIQALGRAKNRARVVRHIKKRAKALGQMKLVKDLRERI
jgi:hypothetical protein